LDIEALKEALGDEKFATLKTFVEDLQGQRDAARNESINGRKGLREKLTAMEASQRTLMEKLGVDSVDEIDALPDAKGLAEAAKQYDVKLKRLERERAEALEKATTVETKWRDSLKRAAVAEAIGKHEFVDREVVESFVSQRLTFEGDDIFFKSEDGKLLPVSDGVAGIAKTRPGLLKPTGAGGAGVRQSNAGGGAAGTKTVSRAEFNAMSTDTRAAIDWKTTTVTD
jgi:hypothetical protein